MNRPTSVLFGCAGTKLTDWERGFFREQRPWGFIVFSRNIEDTEQTRRLTDEMREAVDDPDALVFVDQEGGSVARLKRPHFRHPPSPHLFAKLAKTDPEAAEEAAWLNARLMADEMRSAGITADCAPMLDVVSPKAHAFLQKRALGSDPHTVTALGKAMALGLRDGGVAPVIKHAPGHGKGDQDSHHALPQVDAPREQLEREDFEPFLALKKEAMLMTGHIRFTALDPDNPATLSKEIIQNVIRGQWGYQGLILTDDINMNALGGTLAERSQRALEAGCEIICHCNGERQDMESVASVTRPLSDEGLERGRRARSIALKVKAGFDHEAAKERLKALGLYEEPQPSA